MGPVDPNTAAMHRPHLPAPRCSGGSSASVWHIGRKSCLATRARHVARRNSTHSSVPSAKNWCFHTGSRALTASTNRRTFQMPRDDGPRPPRRPELRRRSAVCRSGGSLQQRALRGLSRTTSATTSASVCSRHRMRRILQPDHRASAIVVPYDAGEAHHRSSGRDWRPTLRVRSGRSADRSRRSATRGVIGGGPHPPADPAHGAPHRSSTPRPSRDPPGDPGRLTISVRPATPHTPRDSTAVGTLGSPERRMASARPGIS